ncbi:MAG: PAS domain S-box protein [Acidobacteria bacterium]|nr:PAS domain S-box protein [Acidobacteriota bacterium]
MLYANPAITRLLGLPIAETIGSNVFQWVHGQDMQTFQASFNRQLDRPGAPVRNAFRLHHQDGTWKHIESVGVNWLDNPGIRGIIINYRNVTDRYDSEEALRQNETWFRRLVEQVTDAIYNCDLTGHFTFFNSTAGRLMKYPQEELLGRHFSTLIRPDYQERAARFYEQQREEQIPSTYFEFPAVAKDGTEVWLGQNVEIQYDGGRPIGVQAIARDITARLAL